MQGYFICQVSIAPLRAEASDRAEIVSQLLFGDRVRLLNTQENWWQVQNHDDGYLGWVDFKQLVAVDEADFKNPSAYSWLAPFNFDNVLLDQNGQAYHLTAGSTLPFFENGQCRIGNLVFDVNFAPLKPAVVNFEEQVQDYAKLFLNAPYLWGGKHVLGIDCSGFTQLVYKMLGIKIPRDASQQAEQGNTVDFLAHAQTGDLAFFDNAEGRITHVGLMLSNDQIIHASGKVRIDPIDNQGIFNSELKKHTHKLRIIKRFI